MRGFIRNTVAGTCLLCAGVANAVPVTLFDWSFRIDGDIFDVFPDTYAAPAPGVLPAAFDVSGFQFSNGPDTAGGLGQIVVTIDAATFGAGDHSVGALFDHELDQDINGLSNESGSAVGVAAAGQNWEIDRPDFNNTTASPGGYFGDIQSNFYGLGADAGTLADNQVFVDAIDGVALGSNGPVDVAMSMVWDFALAVGETAVITFDLTDVAPVGVFFLEHTDLRTDPGTGTSIFFTSALEIIGAPQPVPAPATALLMVAGLLALSRRRRPAQD